THLKKIKSSTDEKRGGSFSFTNSFSLARKLLSSIAPFSSKEIVVFVSAISVVGGNQLIKQFNEAIKEQLRISVLHIFAKTFLNNFITTATKGRHLVLARKSDNKDLKNLSEKISKPLKNIREKLFWIETGLFDNQKYHIELPSAM
ncbi:General transcription factor IIH subunit 2, variant 2, partial [Bonamia ostreae]